MTTTHTKQIMMPCTEGAPTEITKLIPNKIKSPTISYLLVFFLMINRSLNLLMYKALTTFSFYFTQYFEMNNTLFAVMAVMNFPGTLLNMLCVPLYTKYKIKRVLLCLELLLSLSCILMIPMVNGHYLYGLLLCRLFTGFAITAVRTEVNAMIGAFTEENSKHRTQSISIIEYSFSLSSAGFLLVGTVLHVLGWKIFFLGTAGLVCVLMILIAILVPNWHLQFKAGSKDAKKMQDKKNALSGKGLYRVMKEKRLLGIFIAMMLSKIARNAFLYTFSRWMYQMYGLNVLQTGFVTLTIAGGHAVGSSISPFIVHWLGNYGAGLIGSILEILAMVVQLSFYFIGQETPLFAACAVVFFFFCGCQLWYNNLLDICFSLTPSNTTQNLNPTVQTLLFVFGAFGGSIGTIGSTAVYNWGKEVAIALLCALSNIIIAGILIILYTFRPNKQKIISNQTTSNTSNKKTKRYPQSPNSNDTNNSNETNETNETIIHLAVSNANNNDIDNNNPSTASSSIILAQTSDIRFDSIGSAGSGGSRSIINILQNIDTGEQNSNNDNGNNNQFWNTSPLETSINDTDTLIALNDTDRSRRNRDYDFDEKAKMWKSYSSMESALW